MNEKLSTTRLAEFQCRNMQGMIKLFYFLMKYFSSLGFISRLAYSEF